MRRVACAVLFLLVCPAAFSQHFHHRVSLAAGAESPCSSTTLETRLNDMQMVNWPVSHAANAKGEEAQRYFNQGMTEYYGFNYEAAMRSFRKAKSLDPSMAMAPWGIALATGPNINLGMDDECRRVGLQESACAVDLAKNAPDVEKGLTAALALRYAGPLTETVAYGVAMRGVWDRTTKVSTKGADVANVGALYAESLLDMRPWGLYDAAYRPALDTDTINTVLNTAMGAEQDAIGANHLYIHAIEASRFPVCGLPSAQVLERRTHKDGALQKDAPGHLVHMPSHIYLRLGDYAKAIAINAEAVEADRCQYAAACGVAPPTEQCPMRDFCPRLYYGHYLSHNLFFPAVSATFIGRSQAALDWAKQTREHAALFVGGEPGLQRYMTAPLMTLVMNQEWGKILAETPPACPDGCHILTAMYHWARGMAYASTPGAGNVEKASTEYDLMAEQMDAVQNEGPKGWGNNSAAAVLAVAQSTLQAHYTWAGGQCAAYTACLNKPAKVDCKAFNCTGCPQTDQQAVEHLKLAVTHEDALVYDEPPQWFPPAREALGGAYLRMAQRAQGHPNDVPTSLTWYDRAKIVFEEELARHPGSGRALYGKMRAVAKDREFTDQEKKEFCKTWGTADYAMSEERLWPKGDLQVRDYEVRCETAAFQPPPLPQNTPACACDVRQCPRPGAVVIRFVNDDGQDYVIGTASKAPHSPVVLRHLNGAGDELTQWMLDADNGAIILASTFDTPQPLYLTISGSIANKTSLTIEPFAPTSDERRKQSWNWLSAPPRIVSASYPKYAIDNLDCKLKEANRIVLYDTTGKCQKWRVSEAALEGVP